MRKPISSSVISIIAVCLFVSACGHKKINTTGAETGGKKGLLTMSADWVKDKRIRYEANFLMRNESTQDISITLDDLECSKGEQQGTISGKGFVNDSEKMIRINQGQIKRFLLICDHGVKAEGPFVIRLNRVYNNSNNENKGTKAAKVIAKDLIWTTEVPQ